MAEIDEELVLDLNCETTRVITSANGDKIIIENLDLTSEQAATMAWLINHPVGTMLTLQLQIKP